MVKASLPVKGKHYAYTESVVIRSIQYDLITYGRTLLGVVVTNLATNVQRVERTLADCFIE